MTFFSNIFRRIKNWRRPKPPANIEDHLLWLLRPHLATLEHVLLWNNPALSFGFLLFINALVWLLRVSGIPVLGIVGCVLTGAVVLDSVASMGRSRLRGRGGSEPSGGARGPAVAPAPRLQAAAHWAAERLATTYVYLRNLRNENHSKFCFLVSVSISTLWLVVWVGGALLTHAAISAVLLAPLAPSLHAVLTAALHQHSVESDGEMEGFLPEMSPLALHELHQAGEQPLQLPSLSSDLSLPTDVGAALRYAAGEASSSEDEQDAIRDSRIRGGTPDPLSTDSTTDSDTEFLLTDRTKTIKIVKTTGTGVWAPSAPPPKDSDSDEFELIDKDDL